MLASELWNLHQWVCRVCNCKELQTLPATWGPHESVHCKYYGSVHHNFCYYRGTDDPSLPRSLFPGLTWLTQPLPKVCVKLPSVPPFPFLSMVLLWLLMRMGPGILSVVTSTVTKLLPAPWFPPIVHSPQLTLRTQLGLSLICPSTCSPLFFLS